MNLAVEIGNKQRRIEWDAQNRREVEDAKTWYRAARQARRKIVTHDGAVVENFSPDLECFVIGETELQGAQFAVRAFDGEHGDRRIIWDANNPAEVAEAAKLFADYLGRGFLIYSVSPDGQRGFRVRSFNPATQEVVVDETTEQEALEAFQRTFPAGSPDAMMPMQEFIERHKRNAPNPATRTERLSDTVRRNRESTILPPTRPG